MPPNVQTSSAPPVSSPPLFPVPSLKSRLSNRIRLRPSEPGRGTHLWFSMVDRLPGCQLQTPVETWRRSAVPEHGQHLSRCRCQSHRWYVCPDSRRLLYIKRLCPQTSYSTIWPAWTAALVLQDLVRSHSILTHRIWSHLQSPAFTHYNYPGTYQGSDFHYCGTPGNDITDWNDRSQVQNCELANLAECVPLRNRDCVVDS